MLKRSPVDLTACLDLASICLGMRVNLFVVPKGRFGFGPRIARAIADQP